MFSFLQNKPKEERTTCVLVVTSYSVTAAVVRTYHREGAVAKPIVLFSCEEKIQHHHGGRFAEEIKKVLEKCRTIHGNYDKMICVVGEPWAMTKTRTITIEKPKPFKITQKIIDEAVLRDSRLFEQEALRDYAKEQEWGIMHSTRPVASINGYPVSNPLGMMAKSIGLHVTTSLVPTGFFEMIMDVYTDVFHRTDVSFIGMENLISKMIYQSNATGITLGGNTSTISVFTQGVLRHSEVVHQGLVGLEDTIAHLFGVRHAHVASVMKFASDEKLLEHERDVYYRRIASAYEPLSSEIRLALLRIKKQFGTIADPVILIASPAWTGMIQSLIEKDIEQPVIIPHADMLNEQLVYTHEARVKNISLSLAILGGLENYG